MTEEEQNALIEKVANLEQDKANVISELTQKRESERLAKEELERVKKEKESDPSISDPRKIVEEVLNQKEQEAAKEAFKDAIEDLKKTYNEFSQETDAAGIVFGKFENEMRKFNFSGLKTKEEFKARLDEVYNYMNRTLPPKSQEFYQGTRQSGSEQKTTDKNTLSDKEMRLIQSMGWDKERYLKTKAKRPVFIESLLKYRD